MEEEFDNLKELIDANESLKQKLERITKQKLEMNKNLQKTKPKLTGTKLFTQTTGQYSNIKSKLNAETAALNMKTQEEINRIKKGELEMRGCSFTPAINIKSSEISQSQMYIPIYDRPIPEKRVEVQSNKELEYMNELQAIEEKKPKKKADPEFYKRQLDWQKKNEEKQQNERLQKQLSEHSEILKVPKINKDVSIRTIGDTVDFMERLRLQEEKSKYKRQVLDQKYYDNSFKPKINAKSQLVSSRVYHQKTVNEEED